MEFLRKVDLQAPSRSDPDLFSHDAKRHRVAMVPAAKEIFEKKLPQVPSVLVAKGPLGRVC